MENSLTSQEAELALSIITQSGASIRFDANNPDEAIEAANIYKALVHKLRTLAGQPMLNGQKPTKEKA